VATLGTACTADHVNKLFRFTDSVVFSFDGDAAGRRAAGRALEAALPHATDLRQIRFLFLPPEHDPDSFVRALGAAAFEREVERAVPLSRQLVALAGEGADLDTAEGRARLLAQARALWALLPEGAFKHQLMGDLARQAQMTPEDLASQWLRGTSTTPERRAERSLPAQLRRASKGGQRQAPAASADLAVRLLLRHADWWDRLSADDHQLLHDLGGAHGDIVAWLERQLTEHGAMTWSALDEALQGHELFDAARRIADPASIDDQHSLDDLQRVLHRLWIARLGDEADQMVASGQTDREHLVRIDALHKQIARLKVLASAAAPGAAAF
jgi:DNA primase